MCTRTCTGCQRRLPLDCFPLAGKQGRTGTCTVCTNDTRRLRAPLPELPRDPVQVRINNTFNLWHGPVSRAPLRIAA